MAKISVNWLNKWTLKYVRNFSITYWTSKSYSKWDHRSSNSQLTTLWCRSAYWLEVLNLNIPVCGMFYVNWLLSYLYFNNSELWKFRFDLKYVTICVVFNRSHECRVFLGVRRKHPSGSVNQDQVLIKLAWTKHEKLHRSPNVTCR